MALSQSGEPANSELVVGGSDVSVSNPVPVQGSITSAPTLATALNGIADQTVTTTAAALGSLAAGPNGILVRSHPDNATASRIRVATNAAANIGVPLAPGESWTFAVANASDLQVILEAAVTGATKVEVEQG